MRRTLGLGTLAGCLLLAGACGGDDGPNAKRFEGDKKDVAAVIDDLQSFARDGKADEICEEVFTAQLRATIKRETKTACSARVEKQIVNDKATFKLDKVRIDSKDTAVANVTDGSGTKSVLYLAKDDDKWRIGQIAQ